MAVRNAIAGCAGVLALMAGSAAGAQVDPFGALYGQPVQPQPQARGGGAHQGASGRNGVVVGVLSVSGAVGRSYAGSQEKGTVSLAEVARRVMADYPEYEVSVHFGFLFRAVPRGPLTPVHVEAETEEELRRGIGNQITMRRLAGGHAEHREAASRAVREAARNRLLDIPGTVR